MPSAAEQPLSDDLLAVQSLRLLAAVPAVDGTMGKKHGACNGPFAILLALQIHRRTRQCQNDKSTQQLLTANSSFELDRVLKGGQALVPPKRFRKFCPS